MVGENSASEHTQDSFGWAQRWQRELDSARKAFEKTHAQGARIVQIFRDERTSEQEAESRWNLFSSNVELQRSLLFGQNPRSNVSRMFGDAQDDTARVAGEILERLINTDIERYGDGYAPTLDNDLNDWLLAGMGIARVRYEAEWETVPGTPPVLDESTGAELSPAVPNTERKTFEDAPIDYIHWRDVLWGQTRTWPPPWLAFKNEMPKEALEKRFDTPELVKARGGLAITPLVPLRKSGKAEEDTREPDPWSRADVWEIWSYQHRTVFWFVLGMDRLLDSKPDPLGLPGFYPAPRPLLANVTTDTFMPRPDYVLAQDLYREIDTVSTRITLLERAVRVVGVYDKSNPALAKMLSEACQNEMIPLDGWAAFMEKSGVKGAVDWLPLEQIVSALGVLRDYRRELADQLYQVTGVSDIMRGQATQAGATATEQRAKTRFGSVRMDAKQREFARFASDLLRLKGQIIAQHFDAQTILQRCNCENTPDAELAPQAVELIKSDVARFRIEVKPEAISMQDFSALKSDRMEMLTGISTYLTAAAPLMQQEPAAKPMLLEILQWTIAGMRGASTIEGVIDRAVSAAQQAAQAPQPAPPPDPKLLVQQMKGAADLQKVQAETESRVVELQTETEQKRIQEENQARANVAEHTQKLLVTRALKPPEPVGQNGVNR